MTSTKGHSLLAFTLYGRAYALTRSLGLRSWGCSSESKELWCNTGSRLQLLREEECRRPWLRERGEQAFKRKNRDGGTREGKGERSGRKDKGKEGRESKQRCPLFNQERQRSEISEIEETEKPCSSKTCFCCPALVKPQGNWLLCRLTARAGVPPISKQMVLGMGAEYIVTCLIPAESIGDACNQGLGLYLNLHSETTVLRHDASKFGEEPKNQTINKPPTSSLTYPSFKPYALQSSQTGSWLTRRRREIVASILGTLTVPFWP